MTGSALVTEPAIAIALKQTGGRHRRKSDATTSQLTHLLDPTTLAAASRTAPRHRKAPQSAGRTAPRHRKTPQAAAAQTTPRHRKKNRGHLPATFPSFQVAQDNSIRVATRRIALPSALAIGLLAVGGAITGAFSTPLPGLDRASGDTGGMTAALMPSLPALTAMSTPSSDAPQPARVDRAEREPVDASADIAWPIIEQSGSIEVSGARAAPQWERSGTTTIVQDAAREPNAFAPTVTADPPDGHGGGGGPADSAAQPEPPAAGGVFDPGGLLNGIADSPSGSGNAEPREDDLDPPGRADRPGARRMDGPRDARGARGGFGDPGGRGNGSHGGGGQSGGGGQHRGGGSHR